MESVCPIDWLVLILLLLPPVLEYTAILRGARAYDEGDYLGASIYFGEYTKKFDGEQARDAYVLLTQSFLRIPDYASARSVLEEMKQKFDDPRFRCRIAIAEITP